MVPIKLVPAVTPKLVALTTWTIHNVQMGIDMGITAHLTATNFGAV